MQFVQVHTPGRWCARSVTPLATCEMAFWRKELSSFYKNAKAAILTGNASALELVVTTAEVWMLICCFPSLVFRPYSLTVLLVCSEPVCGICH